MIKATSIDVCLRLKWRYKSAQLFELTAIVRMLVRGIIGLFLGKWNLTMQSDEAIFVDHTYFA